MPTITGVAGASATPPALTGTRAQQVAELAEWITARTDDASLGANFTAYADAHPSVTAAQALLGWVLTDAGKALPGAVVATVGEAGSEAVGTAATGAGNGLNDFARSLVPKWVLDVAGVSGWFIRGLKIALGGILMIIGLAHLTGADSAITRIAGKAAL